MSIRIVCPQCKNPVNAAVSTAGNTILCGNCSTAMSVPFPGADAADVAPHPAASEIGTTSYPRFQENNAADDRFAPSKPTNKRGLTALLGFGVVGLLLLGGYFLLGEKKAGAPGGLIDGQAPPGFSIVGDSGCRCYLLLPGHVVGNYTQSGSPQNPKVNRDIYIAMNGDEALFVAIRSPGYVPGTTEEQFMKTFESTPLRNKPSKFDIANKKMITLAGKPALQFTTIEKPDLWDVTPTNAEHFRNKNKAETERVAAEGKQTVYIVTANGEWSYTISITRKLQEPDAGTIKTVVDSVTFD